MKSQIFSYKQSKQNKNPLASLIPIKKYKISGTSMFPALEPGNSVLVSKYFFSKPKIGDVIACLDPRDRKVIIKRITKMKNSMYFITGDNRKESTDSRAFGMITQRHIIGKLIFVI